MALQGLHEDPKTNITVSDAYFRIQNMSGGKEGFTLQVQCWADKSTRDQWDPDLPPGERETEPIGHLYYQFVVDKDSDGILDGDNFFKQAYNYLKTLPEFDGHTDV